MSLIVFAIIVLIVAYLLWLAAGEITDARFQKPVRILILVLAAVVIAHRAGLF